MVALSPVLAHCVTGQRGPFPSPLQEGEAHHWRGQLDSRLCPPRVLFGMLGLIENHSEVEALRFFVRLTLPGTMRSHMLLMVILSKHFRLNFCCAVSFSCVDSAWETLCVLFTLCSVRC